MSTWHPMTSRLQIANSLQKEIHTQHIWASHQGKDPTVMSDPANMVAYTEKENMRLRKENN